jgi:hypothetical protein
MLYFTIQLQTGTKDEPHAFKFNLGTQIDYNENRYRQLQTLDYINLAQLITNIFQFTYKL